MHEHVSKRVKMHRKPTDGINKHDKHSIERKGQGKGVHEATWYPKTPPKWLHSNKASWALGVTIQIKPTEGIKHGKT